jgi:hypothetical protein
LDNVGPAAGTVAAVPPTNAESTPLLAELPPVISANAKPPLPIFEKELSRPPLSSQLNNLEPAAKTVSVVPPTDAESAVIQPREAKPLLSEVPSLDSTNTKTPPLYFENEPSPISLSGQPDHAEPPAKIVAAAPPAGAEDPRPQQGKSLLAELPPSHCFFEGDPSPTTLSGELDNVVPAVKTVAVGPPTHAVAMEPQQTKSLPLADLRPLVSTNKKPSPPIFEKDSPPPSLSGQLDNVEPAAKAVAVAPPTDAQSTLPTQAKSLQAEKLPPISTNTKPSFPFEEAPSRPSFYGRLDNVGPAVRAVAVSAPPTMDGAVTRAQLAKSLLAELDLNTAIRLRWVMRDIRGKRAAISPASKNDLATLIDLGLVEMREELPSLTASGVLALD